MVLQSRVLFCHLPGLRPQEERERDILVGMVGLEETVCERS